MNYPLYLCVIGVLIVFSAYFSGTEIAYTSVKPGRLHEKYEKKKTLSLRFSVYFLSHFDNMLAAILIGNNVVNQFASSLATVVVISLLGENFSWVATAAMTVLVLIFGEVMPKTIGKARSEAVCVISAVPLRFLSVIFFPLIYAVNKLMELLSHMWEKHRQDDEMPISEGELSSVMDIVGSEGVIDEAHTALVKRAIDYKDIRAYEIITPRVDVEYIDLSDSAEDIIAQALASGHSRLPVSDGDADSVLGVLHLNKLLFRIESGEITKDSDITAYIKELMSPPIFIPKTAPVHSAVELMREKQQQMLLVVDSYGGVMGILTMEDALEVIVGDIWDESDEIVPDIIKVGDNEYDVSAKLRLRELFGELASDSETLPTDDIENEFTVLGGWCSAMLGISPEEGDSFTFGDMTFTVRTLRDKTPDRLTVKVAGGSGEDGDSK